MKAKYQCMQKMVQKILHLVLCVWYVCVRWRVLSTEVDTWETPESLCKQIHNWNSLFTYTSSVTLLLLASITYLWFFSLFSSQLTLRFFYAYILYQQVVNHVESPLQEIEHKFGLQEVYLVRETLNICAKPLKGKPLFKSVHK